MQKILDFTVDNPLENVYHIQDATETCATLIVGQERALLVDTCTGCGSLKTVVEMLTSLPYDVCNTHAHLDHMGGNYQFEAAFLNPREFDIGRLYIDQLDIRPAVLERFSQMGCQMEQPEKYLTYNMENIRSLNMDGEFDLGGIHVRPIPMYSHSPGMTGFYVPERKLLLGGDSVCILVCLYFQEASSVEQHSRMLDEVAKIDFSYILTSHSRELLTRDDFEAMRECAASYDAAKTFRYADHFYPQFGGRMYLYESTKGKHAIVVAKKEDQ